MQSKYGSNQNKIYSYPGEEQKKYSLQIGTNGISELFKTE